MLERMWVGGGGGAGGRTVGLAAVGGGTGGGGGGAGADMGATGTRGGEEGPGGLMGPFGSTMLFFEGGRPGGVGAGEVGTPPDPELALLSPRTDPLLESSPLLSDEPRRAPPVA